MSDAKQIAFLGLGAMGERMATRLAAAGHEVRVWNRSGVPATATALAALAQPTPREAARDAELVFSMVTDDEASRSIWLDPKRGALEAMSQGTVAIECSTLTPAWVVELAAEMKSANVRFLDAPVVGSRPHAEGGSLAFLVGGDAATLERVRPVLSQLGKVIHHCGATPAGSQAKLFANSLLAVQVAALAELIAFAQKANLEVDKLVASLDGLAMVSASAKASAVGMVAKSFAPLFPVDLISKDLRYVLSTAASASAEMPVLTRVSEIFEAGRESGLGKENMTAIRKLYS